MRHRDVDASLNLTIYPNEGKGQALKPNMTFCFCLSHVDNSHKK